MYTSELSVVIKSVTAVLINYAISPAVPAIVYHGITIIFWSDSLTMHNQLVLLVSLSSVLGLLSFLSPKLILSFSFLTRVMPQ